MSGHAKKQHQSKPGPAPSEPEWPHSPVIELTPEEADRFGATGEISERVETWARKHATSASKPTSRSKSRG